MKQNELILEYLDGTLDPAVEQELFETLAGQPELRTTLRGFVQIGDAVRGDREAFTPPAAVEASLMRRLGLASVPADSTRGAGLIGFFRSRALGLATAFILGVLLTAGVYSVAIEDDTTQSVATASVDHSVSSPRSSIVGRGTPPGADPAVRDGGAGIAQQVPRQPADRSDIRSMSAPRSPSERSPALPPARPGARSRAHRLNTLPSATTLVEQEHPEQRRTARADDRPEIIRNVHVDNPKSMYQGDSNPIVHLRNGIDPALNYPRLNSGSSLSIDLSVPRDAERSGWIVELRHGFVSTDLQDVAALTPTTSWVEDGAVGVYHHLGPDVALGVELGSERYAQRISHVAGDTVAIDQRPLYMWGGGALRYYPGEFLGLDPVIQGGLGVARPGPVLRGRLGLSRSILSGFRLGLGLESSALLYRAGDIRQISGRWGGFAGLEVALP